MLCTAEEARITESVVTSCGKSLMLKVRYEIFTFTNIDYRPVYTPVTRLSLYDSVC